MDFLIDASLPRSTASTIASQGHQAIDVRDIGLGTADDSIIAAYALTQRLCLVTRDYDFADVRNYPPLQYAGIVVVDATPSYARHDQPFDRGLFETAGNCRSHPWAACDS
jgi:hypothetical protein